MNTEQKTPEFGYNGAVLNSETMTDPLKQEYERAAEKSRAWRLWALIYWPFWIASMVAGEIFGFAVVFPVLMVILVSATLYQRYINRRSWDAILFGIHRPKGK